MGSCRIMGILNVTPDSFYDGGKYADKNRAIERAYRIRDEGADLIDIGGESTRPGSKQVAAQEEIDRVCPVIEAIAGDIAIPISIDTTKSGVARAALDAGASIVNDISGLTFDPDMTGTVARSGAGVVIMHIQGRPETMQRNPRYDDLIAEIYQFLEEAVRKAVKAGIAQSRIIVDPGIGFGKTAGDNYRIINNIHEFKRLGLPVLVGLSRKSFTGNTGGLDSDRLPATIALNTVSIINGADVIRVHDVKEHRLALMSLDTLKRNS